MPRRLGFLLLILCAVLAVGLTRLLTAPRVGPGDADYRSAQKSSESGDYNGAIRSLRLAVVRDPANGDYHAELGNLFLETRQPEFALPELQAAAFLTPDRPHIYCQLAQAAVELRRRDDAYVMLEEALRRAPDCPHALGVKGEQALRDDNLKEALAVFQKLAKVSPGTVMAHQKVGYALLSVNRPDEAIEALKEGLKIHPTDSGLHALLGEAYSKRHNVPGWDALAEEHLRRAIPNNPEAMRARAALGNLYLRRGDLKAARAEFETVLKEPQPMQSALYGLSQVARRENRIEEADRLLATFRKRQAESREVTELQDKSIAAPKDLALQIRLARLSMSRGLLSSAYRALDTAVANDPANRAVRELRAEVFRRLGREKQAAGEYAIAATLPAAGSSR